ncbi:hypothetical protein FNV43_RR09090 [Rhamnella rubrinervis]|uniref:Pentatricopeptide repeat-containing protein n=1 Tax=Rhamnella rubrinervis TaxID=2594499 RepID=A0A8K0H9H5_9ROSA|nr:hypothetical protein FNV43_RR09090 [Rhamnella rubrinervis]
MWRSPALSFLAGRITQRGVSRIQNVSSSYRLITQAQISNQSTANALEPLQDQYNVQDHQYNSQDNRQCSEKNDVGVQKDRLSENISRKDKIDFLVKTLIDLRDTKEAVYGALDAWVAWEQNFPIASLKRAMLALEKEQQWHRIVQVIKWMLSKGQGTTMGTYCQLIRALDMDQRADEAHKFWEKKIGIDLHSVPWQLCRQMIAIYYRNNMLENLVKLFEGLEAFDRKPPEKSIVQRVANAYELLGKLKEKERVLEKYNYLLTETESAKKSKKKALSKKKKKKPVKSF